MVLAVLMKKRAIDLEKGLRELLDDPEGTGLVKSLYEHPLIDGLFAGEYKNEKGGRIWSNLPSYIPSEFFAGALIDLILRSAVAAPAAQGAGQQPAAPQAPAAAPAAALQAPANPAADALQALGHAIDALPDTLRVKPALVALVNPPCADMQQAKANLEAWFNGSMDRVAGWYKRWSQWVIFFLGLVLVVILNADTIAVGNSLAEDPSLRQSVVAAAQESVKARPDDTKDAAAERLEAHLKELRTLGFPIGWTEATRGPGRATTAGAG
jgi:hypothetical protein